MTDDHKRVNLWIPTDWVAAIDEARGSGTDAEEPLAEWIRGAILKRLGKAAAAKLSEMPAPGRRWPKN